MPGQPDPVYPPGPFSSWNRPSTRAAWLGMIPAGDDPGEGDGEPGYSVLAVSDPSADATSTQTWAAIEDTGDWPASGAEPHRATGAGEGAPRRRPPEDEPAAPMAVTALEGGNRAERGGTHAGHSRRAGQAGHGRRAASGRQAGPGRAAGMGRRSTLLLTGLLLAPVVVVGIVVAAYVHLNRSHRAEEAHAVPTQPVAVPSSPAASLGPWKYITARQDDPQPLGLAELFPPQFSTSGVSATRTVDKAGTSCASAVIGSALRAAVRKASCTQVMRASYLSTSRKLMATIGVLNLATAAQAERVGKASGSTEFIDQLPAAHGPTRNLKKAAGIEEPIVKGHYLILIVAEFADLHSPSGHARRAELEKFETGLFNGTVNVSLTSRMVTGKPRTP